MLAKSILILQGDLLRPPFIGSKITTQKIPCPTKWENLVGAIVLRVIVLEKILYLLAYFNLPVLRNLPHQDLQNVSNSSKQSVEFIAQNFVFKGQKHLLLNITSTKIFQKLGLYKPCNISWVANTQQK